MNRRLLIIFLLFIFCQLKSGALEIVYPKVNPYKTDSDAAFFIGSVKPNEKLKINGISVKVSEQGAFAQNVLLNYGKNVFEIESENTEKQQNKISFIIERPEIKNSKIQSIKLIEYPNKIIFYTKSDNTPLRSTPFNSGINRLSHLEKNTQVITVGEQGNFYKIYLGENRFAWIEKSNLEQNIEPEFAVIKKAVCKNYEEMTLYKFELSKKIPFALEEANNGLDFELFNIQGQENNHFKMTAESQKLFGYQAFFEGSDFYLKVRKHPKINCRKPLNNISVTIDAGHGGKDSGAIGCCGAKEKDINLAIAKHLNSELKTRGAKPFLTREDDIFVELKDRIQKSKENDSMILISIHANAVPDGVDPNKNKGTSVYYYHPQAKPLAESILDSMTTQLCTNNDRVRQGSLALVRPTESVSVLIEVAYMINPDDYALLTDKDFQKRCAKAIADGIEDYLKK